MKFLEAALIITAFAFITPFVLANQEVTDEKVLGEKLLRQLWGNIKKPNMDAIQKTMAQGFQSVHQFGANDRDQELKLIKDLKLGDYTLTDIEITRTGPVIVATYFISVEETIKGDRLSKKPAPRLSIFLKTDSGWKWIAHANLKPLK